MIEKSETSPVDGVLNRSSLSGVAKGDGGPVDTLLQIIIDYLQNDFKGFSLSDGNTTQVNFYMYYPYDDLTLPIVVVDAGEVNIDNAFIGGVLFEDDAGEPYHVLRGKVEVIFDVLSRTIREKQSIAGYLANSLYRGLYINGLLRERGINIISFARSVNRGMEQADKVLHLHSHQAISDVVHRIVLTYIFDFFVPITNIEETIETPYFIHSIGSSYNGESKSYVDNSAYLELKFNYV